MGVFDKSRHGLASSARRLVIEAGYPFWPGNAASSETDPGSTGTISTMGRRSLVGPDAVKPGIEGVWTRWNPGFMASRRRTRRRTRPARLLACAPGLLACSPAHPLRTRCAPAAPG